jgi:hypothetical protein
LSLDDLALLRFKLRTTARTSSQVIGIFTSPKVDLFFISIAVVKKCFKLGNDFCFNVIVPFSISLTDIPCFPYVYFAHDFFSECARLIIIDHIFVSNKISLEILPVSQLLTIAEIGTVGKNVTVTKMTVIFLWCQLHKKTFQLHEFPISSL